MPIYRPQWPSFSASRRRVSNHRLPPPPCFCRRLLPLRAGGDEPKVTREYKEGDAKFTVNSEPAPSEPSSNPNSVYADQLPEVGLVGPSQNEKRRKEESRYHMGALIIPMN